MSTGQDKDLVNISARNTMNVRAKMDLARERPKPGRQTTNARAVNFEVSSLLYFCELSVTFDSNWMTILIILIQNTNLRIEEIIIYYILDISVK